MMATEKRLIRYDGLKQEIIDFKKGLNPKNTDYATGYFSALSVVEGMMVQHIATDAVEVVRCEDCKKWFRHTEVDRERGECRRYQTTKHESGYCDRGERKDND